MIDDLAFVEFEQVKHFLENLRVFASAVFFYSSYKIIAFNVIFII